MALYPCRWAWDTDLGGNNQDQLWISSTASVISRAGSSVRRQSQRLLAPVPHADGCAGDSVRQAPVGDTEARLAVRAAFFMPLSLGGEGMTDELPSQRASSERPTNSFYRTRHSLSGAAVCLPTF